MNLHEHIEIQEPAPERPQLSTQYKQMYREVFNFHARHGPAPQSPEQWQAAAEDLIRTADKMGNTPFINALLTAVYEEMERQKEAEALQPGLRSQS